MQWSWQTPDFVNDINHAIYEVESLSSTEAMAGGFSSGMPSRNGMKITLRKHAYAICTCDYYTPRKTKF